jgi:hypothetical protein
MAKKEVIEQIQAVTDMFSKSELEGKKVEELEKILKLGQSVAQQKDQLKEKNEDFVGKKSEDFVDEKPQKFSRMKKPTLDKNELIPVMNITNGPLLYISLKTGMSVKFEQYGDVEYLEVGELLTMRSSQKRYLEEPWMLIMDEEIVNYLGLDKLYQKLISPQNIDKIFTFDQATFQEIIENAPMGYNQLIISRAKQRLKDGSLDSLAKIKILEEKFNIQLVV